LAVLCGATAAYAQTAAETFEPQVGQAGKDVVWVPTPPEVVDKILELTKTTSRDIFFDLGSGDGRMVIGAAKLGATATGIEYNPDMVELSKRSAAAAGLSSKATFMKADLFESDFSNATVITMFLLPSINIQLRPKLLELKPGTRIASNTFSMEDWAPDETATIAGDCTSWCTALLWIVPAKVEGKWQTPQGALTLTQAFQVVTGTLGETEISNGGLWGDELTFTAGDTTYVGRVDGETIRGTAGAGTSWTATLSQ